MTIDTNIDRFYGRAIEAFEKGKPVQDSGKAIRLEVDYETAEAGGTMSALLEELKKDPAASKIEAIVLGAWEEAYDVAASEFIEFFIENKGVFTSLKALFIGEMTYEENEISWIIQGNYQTLLETYDALEHLQIRGGGGLELGQLDHARLKTLIIETGGLDKAVVDSVAQATLPALEHLELWLGTEDYGWNGSVNNVLPLLQASKFSGLTHLAIKNSEIQDEVVTAICKSDLLPQLDVIDVSMGVMSDEGGDALLSSLAALVGKRINASENYLSDSMAAKLSGSDLDIDVSEQKEPDEYDGEEYRYVSVAE